MNNGRASIVDAAWQRARVTAEVRKALGVLQNKEDRLAILLQIVAEDYPEDGPTSQVSSTMEPAVTSKPKALPYDTPELRAALLKAIPAHEVGTTVPDIFGETRILPSRIRQILPVMEAEGLIERINRSRWRKTKQKEKDQTLVSGKAPVASTPDLSQGSLALQCKKRSFNHRTKAAADRRTKIYEAFKHFGTEVTSQHIVDFCKFDEIKTISTDLYIMRKIGMVKRRDEFSGSPPSKTSYWRLGDVPFNTDAIAIESSRIQNERILNRAKAAQKGK